MASRRTCHVKGCNKVPTFNKVRKTSGKYCGEHKKENMVNVMYRNYDNPRQDHLFKLLPRDLQWEIMTDFVGGYVVRYNRLRRIMSGEVQQKIMEHIFQINDLSWRRLWLKPNIRYPFHLGNDPYYLSTQIYNRWKVKYFKSDGTQTYVDSNCKIGDDVGFDYSRGEDYPGHPPKIQNLIAVAVAELSRRKACVVLFESKSFPRRGRLSYGFTRGNYCLAGESKWYITEVDDSVVLPPYERHVYPSYPYTNKKLGRPVLKMKVHNPLAATPERLNYEEKKTWMNGVYI